MTTLSARTWKSCPSRCPLDLQVKRNALGAFFHSTHPCLPGHLQIYLNMNKPKNTVCQKSRRIWLMLTPGGPPLSIFFANYSKQPLANHTWNFMTFPRYQLPGIPAKKNPKILSDPHFKALFEKVSINDQIKSSDQKMIFLKVVRNFTY